MNVCIFGRNSLRSFLCDFRNRDKRVAAARIIPDESMTLRNIISRGIRDAFYVAFEITLNGGLYNGGFKAAGEVNASHRGAFNAINLAHRRNSKIAGKQRDPLFFPLPCFFPRSWIARWRWLAVGETDDESLAGRTPDRFARSPRLVVSDANYRRDPSKLRPSVTWRRIVEVYR